MINEVNAAKEKVDKVLCDMREQIHERDLLVVGNIRDILSLQEWQIRQNGTLEKIEKRLEQIERKVLIAIITFLSGVAVGAVLIAIRAGVGG